MEPKRLVAALILLSVVSGVLLYGNLSTLGIWEPWEANSIVVAQEYTRRGPAPAQSDPKAPSYNWAVPTLDSKPVAQSLLKTWLISARLPEQTNAGELEWSARSTITHVCFLFTAFGLFFWVRRFTQVKTGLLAGLAFVSMPAIYLGAHNLSSELLYVLTSSTALMALFGGSTEESPKRRWIWGAIFGVGLSLTFLDQRMIGVDLVLLVTAAWALSEMAFEGHEKPIWGQRELGAAFAILGLGLATLFWALSGDAEGFLPHRLQIAGLLIPLFLTTAALAFARQTTVVKTLASAPFLAGIAVTAAVAIAVGHTYGAANPTLLEHGEVFGQIPVLSFFLENQIFGKSLATEHMTFDLLTREIGFSLVPWVALAPLALGYTARASRATEDALDVRSRLMRFVLVWAVFGAFVTSAASAFGHFFYPGYVPIAVAVALMFADHDFWKEVRLKPLLAYAMGFTAICITMMLMKDLERFPMRFIEVYTAFEPKFKFPDDFGFGKSLKVFKYGTAIMLAVFFFGLGSTAIVWAQNAQTLKGRLADWWKARRTDSPITLFEPLASDTVIIDRAQHKEDIRQSDAWYGKPLRYLELPDGPVYVITAFFVALAGVVLFVYQPMLANHTSQRGVFETYQSSAKNGEELFRYDVVGRDNSVYLSNISTIKNTRAFLTKFKDESRFFAVIPRKNLARINYEVRRETGRNLPVLDARSSRLLLVSNAIDEGQKDHNFVTESIIEDESVIQYPITFKSNKTDQHPVFDGQLEMLGFSLDHPPEKDGHASYKWDEVAVIDYYFKVLKRVPNNQKIFLHVDYPGNRINGDHYPNDGEFPTNYWLPGDIVRSRQHLTIENYSTPGVYSLNFGFFVGSKRMKVTPREAHDGGNRVKVGQFRVTGL